ncbi:MAG TPA: hypothetical protein VF670_01710 [Duganella sp.]|jgi:hypothetical protein
MLHPLCSLWRHDRRVAFYEAGGHAGPSGHSGARSFLNADDALHYLRYWMGEPGARAELQWVLHKACSSSASARGGDGWLAALAARIAGGAIVVVEELRRRAAPGRLVAPGGAGAAAAATAQGLAALPLLASVPKAPAVVALLPVLEEVRIEGAEVLPELDQSLEQVELSIAKFSGASLSLDPAPDKVGEIADAMSTAADDAKKALAAL